MSGFRTPPQRRWRSAGTEDLPTPRSTLEARYVTLLVWCKGGCRHQAEADLHRLVETGRGDVPLTALRFRCTNCRSIRTDWVVMSRDALAARPWRRAP
jgi:hypothetical protein